MEEVSALAGSLQKFAAGIEEMVALFKFEREEENPVK